MLTSRRGLLIMALLGAILAASLIQWPRVADPATIQDDFRKFHWLHRYEDPELFAADPLSSPQEIRVGPFLLLFEKTRPGYGLLFGLGSLLFPVLLLNKLLIIPLLLLSVFFLFRIGEMAGDEWTGFVLALAFVVLTNVWASATSVAAGLPRSFMAPVLLGIVYALMRDRFWLAIAIALLGATIYLPAAVLGLATITLAAVERAPRPWRYRIGWRRLLPLAVVVGLLFVVYPALISTRLEALWDSFSEGGQAFGALLDDPNYVSGGRLPLFRDFPFQGLGALANNFPSLWSLLILTPLALAAGLLDPGAFRRFPRVLKLLFAASFVLFVLAWLAILVTGSLILYFPSRYTHLSLDLVLLAFVVMNGGGAARLLWRALTRGSPGRRAANVLGVAAATVLVYYLLERYGIWGRIGADPASIRVAIMAGLACLMASVVLLVTTGRPEAEGGATREPGARKLATKTALVVGAAAVAFVVLPSNDHHYFPLTPREGGLVEFFRSTPKDSLAAGDPCALDSVPMAAGRQVLFSCELFPLSAEGRAMATLRAHYANSLGEVRAFCEAYGVDYFVVSPARFEDPQGGWIFFEPYGSLLRPEIVARPGYALAPVPEAMRLYEGENVVVMGCRRFDLGSLKGRQVTDDGLSVLGFGPLPAAVSQAESDGLRVTVTWAAEGPLAADHEVCFAVKDGTGVTIQSTCRPVSADLSTSQWAVPEIRIESYDLNVGPYLESVPYWIVASVDAATDGSGQEGMVIGHFAYSALPRRFAPPGVEAAAPLAVWGERIALAHFEVSGPEADALALDVSWRALRRMVESYKFFAHLREAGTGRIASQVDLIPLDWSYPTSWWEENELIDDRLSIPLDNVGPGRYELWIGFYDEVSGERLPLSATGPGLPGQDQAIKVYEVER
jgi:hypothetical protein